MRWTLGCWEVPASPRWNTSSMPSWSQHCRTSFISVLDAWLFAFIWTWRLFAFINNQSMKCSLSHSAQSPVFTWYPFFFPPVFLGTDKKSRPAKGLKSKAGSTGSNKFDKVLFPLFSPSAKGFSCHTTHPAFLESTSNVHLPQWWVQTIGGTVTTSINNKILSCYNLVVSNE